MEFIDFLLSKLAPHICVGCGQEGTLMCPGCGMGLEIPDSFGPAGCLRSIRAAAVYDGIAKDLVWQLKFRGAPAAAGTMARYMIPLVRVDDPKPVIVPVPTATRRARQRGFDQAKLLARQLSKFTGLPYRDCLRRQGQSHQVGASRQQRLSQLQGAFRLKGGANLRGSTVILVDDVLTTGATLETAAMVLHSAGNRDVEAVVFAQT